MPPPKQKSFRPPFAKKRKIYNPDTLSGLRPDPEYTTAPEPSQASAIVDRLLQKLRLDDHVQNRKIREIWPGLVGEHLAQKSYPDELKRGILTVRIADAATHHHLRALKGELLKKLQSSSPSSHVVRDIRFLH